VRGVADGGADHAGREVGVLIGDEAVVREAAIAAEVARQRTGLLAVGADEAAFAVAA
jgi:acyl-[acyl carrier protein]--UDP-N-acetylglucosamine O-acyltransferase